MEGEFAFQNRLSLKWEGKMHLKIQWASFGRKFMSVVCRTVLLKLALRKQIFLKLSHARCEVLCLNHYGPRKSNRRLKSELHKQQYTVTLYDCNHLAHVTVLWQMQNLCLTVLLLLSYISNLMAIKFQVQDQGACIWRGDLLEVFFAL